MAALNFVTAIRPLPAIAANTTLVEPCVAMVLSLLKSVLRASKAIDDVITNVLFGPRQ